MRAVDELKPETVVLLGDVVHASGPSGEERDVVQRTLDAIRANARLIAVRGNHDRAFARDYGFEMAGQWECEDVLAVHGDRHSSPGGRHLVIGHVHPALGISDHAGASQRVPVFLVSPLMTVLPAFSPFAAGIDVRFRMPLPLNALLQETDVHVFAATGRRVVPLGSLARL
jgi:metallophosphoesterase superfamily enzyme